MKYIPRKYGAWHFGVIDSDTNLFVRKSDGKLLMFKSKAEAQIWCDSNN